MGVSTRRCSDSILRRPVGGYLGFRRCPVAGTVALKFQNVGFRTGVERKCQYQIAKPFTADLDAVAQARCAVHIRRTVEKIRCRLVVVPRIHAKLLSGFCQVTCHDVSVAQAFHVAERICSAGNDARQVQVAQISTCLRVDNLDIFMVVHAVEFACVVAEVTYLCCVPAEFRCRTLGLAAIPAFRERQQRLFDCSRQVDGHAVGTALHFHIAGIRAHFARCVQRYGERTSGASIPVRGGYFER